MTDKTDERVVAEWMGVDFYDVYYPSMGGRDDKATMRKMERKLAESGLTYAYSGKLFELFTEPTVCERQALMTATDAQRVKAAAETIRGG